MSAKTYDRQSGKLLARIAENLPDLASGVMQRWIDNPKDLQKFLQGLDPASLEASLETDNIIRVDRSIRPAYPEWVKTVMYPELENSGPVEYDITKVDLWLHDGQKDGSSINGHKIHAYLKNTGDLKNHLDLRDLEEIKKKGIAFFRKHFKGKYVFGWTSVVRDSSDYLSAPYLYEEGDRVVLNWRWLGLVWHGSDRRSVMQVSSVT